MIIKTFIEGPINANNYLLIDETSNEAVMIDCSDAREDVLNEIKESGVNLKYILLTHGHFDHILGVDKYKEVFGVDAFVAKDDIVQIEASGYMMMMFSGIEPEEIKTITHFVKDGDEFFIGRIKIKAISTPGHTEGGMSYYVENEGKLFSGDTLFQNSVGRSDLQGGNLKKLVDSVKNILFTLPESTEVYTGHGNMTTIGFEKKYNEILNI